MKKYILILGFCVAFEASASAAPPVGMTPTLSTSDAALTRTVIDCAQRGGSASSAQYVVTRVSQAQNYGTANVDFRGPSGQVVDSFAVVLTQGDNGNWSCTGGNKAPVEMKAMLQNAGVTPQAVAAFTTSASRPVVSYPVTMHGQTLSYTALKPIPQSPLVQFPNLSSTDLSARLYNAANAFRGTDTAWQGTGGGGRACAAAVQKIVYRATNSMIGSWNVDDWWALAINSPGKYGGHFLLPSESHLARQGDIVIWDVLSSTWKGHIGFCATDGCSKTWSNSSSLHTFAPTQNDRAGLYFFGEFDSSSTVIWEPSHIP